MTPAAAALCGIGMGLFFVLGKARRRRIQLAQRIETGAVVVNPPKSQGSSAQ